MSIWITDASWKRKMFLLLLLLWFKLEHSWYVVCILTESLLWIHVFLCKGVDPNSPEHFVQWITHSPVVHVQPAELYSRSPTLSIIPFYVCLEGEYSHYYSSLCALKWQVSRPRHAEKGGTLCILYQMMHFGWLQKQGGDTVCPALILGGGNYHELGLYPWRPSSAFTLCCIKTR